MASPAPNPTTNGREPSRRARRGPSARYTQERERVLSTSSAQDLIRLLIEEEHESKSSRGLLQTALRRLDEEARRADAAVARANESAQRFRVLTAELLNAQGEVARTREQLGMYKVQLDAAQREIERAEDVIRVVERERDEAEQEAARARTAARRISEETLVERAREEGRRLGYEEGLRSGRDFVGDSDDFESFMEGTLPGARPRSESLSSVVTGLSALDLVALPNPGRDRRSTLSVIPEDIRSPSPSARPGPSRQTFNNESAHLSPVNRPPSIGQGSSRAWEKSRVHSSSDAISIDIVPPSQTSSYTTIPSSSSHPITRPRTRPSPPPAPIGIQIHSPKPSVPLRLPDADDYVEVPTVPNSPRESYHDVVDYTGIGSGGGIHGRAHPVNGISPVESREGSTKSRREGSDRYRPELRHQRSTTSVGSTSSYSRFDPSTYLDPAYYVDSSSR